MGTDDDRDDQRQADEPVRCTWTSAEAQARWPDEELFSNQTVEAMTRDPQRSIREPDRASQRTDLSFGAAPPALLVAGRLPINCETAN